ncbi:PREDICTED: sprT-like domain-containing protein Spartan [Dinoponera quadriceps]|uniref:Protein with SprT-like domain at the N terminus n=1 Tax=Dinoponera quadriceps TaxID=609295 RepID=A0A6P3XAZ9_DINQU|nr:PREDICTED: sprT-like domain-containing protein Spartan [Dinoponera quadriceps]XP_014475059.1 PREDICTED: sprT-like domain-containing protein Spartan [Dinoponera quadriceps]
MASQKKKDFLVAFDIHEELNCLGVTENAIHPEKENYKPRTLVDHTLELIDPTPNIYTLFVQFNIRFFWSVLCSVEVKWSSRMTSCAGVCTFHNNNKQCVISLSAPLLKLRPRKDLVETLLHEMIHAYLFLTNNNRNRDGHGPNFCEHMHRINKEAGTNITIYHSFHDEVRLYQQHWWKCNGPCQHRPPFFGMVRRATNRAPGPSDFWWLRHKVNCNGEFVKIKEPENFKSKQNNKSDKNISDWLTKNTPAKAKPAYSKVFTNNNRTFIQTNRNKTINNKDMTNSPGIRVEKNDSGMKKLGNTSNNVHGWNIGGPSGKVESNTKNIASKSPTFAYSGTLGGSNSGQSNLLRKFLHISKNGPNELTKKDLSSKSPSAAEKKPANKPFSNLNQPMNQIRKRTDGKFDRKSGPLINKLNNSSNEKLASPIRIFFTTANTDSNKRVKLDDSSDTKYVSCPVCNKMVPAADINQHLDECLLENDSVHKTCILSTSQASNDSIISISSSNSDLDNSVIEYPKSCIDVSANESNATNREQQCLVCNAQIAPGVSLSEHLDECIGAVFDDKFVINDEDDTSAAGNDSIETKHPCPVCMQMIPESFMNQHLDTCLENKYRLENDN